MLLVLRFGFEKVTAIVMPYLHYEPLLITTTSKNYVFAAAIDLIKSVDCNQLSQCIDELRNASMQIFLLYS
jgi:hypothetical protein